MFSFKKYRKENRERLNLYKRLWARNWRKRKGMKPSKKAKIPINIPPRRRYEKHKKKEGGLFEEGFSRGKSYKEYLIEEKNRKKKHEIFNT